MPDSPSPAVEQTACAMRLRAYPTQGQTRRLGTWLWAAHRFRNEAVAFTQDRRRARAAWLARHPALARDWVPEELAGNDVLHCSRWLTQRLEQARRAVRLEGAVVAGKHDLVPAVDQVLRHLSRGEREAIPDAWLLSVPRTVFDQVLQDLARTLAKACSDRKAGSGRDSQGAGRKTGSRRAAGFPRFQKWSYPGSVRLQVEAKKNAAFRDHWAAGEVFVPGLGRLRFRDAGYVLPATPPKLITVSRDAAGRIHVAFLCVAGEERFNEKRQARDAGKNSFNAETDVTSAGNHSFAPLPLDPETGLPVCVGLDVGLESLVALDSGKKTPPNRHLRRCQSRLRFLGQRLAKRKKGSKRWQKTRAQIGQTHVRVVDCREASLRQEAKKVVDPVAIVCAESLILAFMLQNRHLAFAAHDAALGRFLTLIQHECRKQGKLFLRAGRFDASTQTCSACGTVNPLLKNNLKRRTWDCPSCGAHHDRDVNAAVNIRRMALDRACTDFSSVPESGIGMRLPYRLHPDLDAFVARGGLAALREQYRFTRERRQVGGTPGLGTVDPDEARIPPEKPARARRERACAG